MASVSAVRDGLAVRLRTISGLQVSDVRGSITPPAAVIVPGVPGTSRPAISFDATFARGADDLLLTVYVLVSAATDSASQSALDDYLAGDGAKSVKAAIEDEDSLGGAAHFARVAQVANYGLVEWGGLEYLGAQFVVEVTA